MVSTLDFDPAIQISVGPDGNIFVTEAIHVHLGTLKM